MIANGNEGITALRAKELWEWSPFEALSLRKSGGGTMALLSILKSFSIGAVISADKQNKAQVRKVKLCPLRQHLSMMGCLTNFIRQLAITSRALSSVSSFGWISTGNIFHLVYKIIRILKDIEGSVCVCVLL